MYEAGLTLLLTAIVIGSVAVTIALAEWMDKRRIEKRIRERY